MSEPIREGDLVQVKFPAECCGGGAPVGMIRGVLAIKRFITGRCSSCYEIITHDVCAELEGDAPWMTYHIPLYRLRRIPPLSELETQHTENEVTA